MGWQHQDHGPSVQHTLEQAILGITGEQVHVYGAGRTDSGVHARGQVAHVDVEKPITPFRLGEALNAHLRKCPDAPAAVSVLHCAQAKPDFHARFDARQRHYQYRIINRRAPLTVERGLAWHVRVPLDADAMNVAAQLFCGTHDFTTFRSVHCQSASPVKSIDRFAVSRSGETICVDVAARSFLHHQVRSMVGCLKLVGEGKWTDADLKAALLAADRARLGYNAPPDGLYFMQVDYPDATG